MAVDQAEIIERYRAALRDATAYPSDEYFFGYPRRGIAVIINNMMFDPITQQEQRIGAEYDTQRLEDMYNVLGFDVRKYENLSTTEMLAKLHEVSQEDHSQFDCFSCAISSHGCRSQTHVGGDEYMEADIIYGRNGILRLKLVTEMFDDQHCKTLQDKPRIFIIQACRGEGVCDSVTVKTTREVQPSQPHPSATDTDHTQNNTTHTPERFLIYQDLPLYKDCILAYSAPPGFSSFRRGTGSWYITALSDIISRYSDKLDLHTMLTMTNQVIVEKYQCNKPSNRHLHRRQIVPWIASKLTKQIYFPVKPNDAYRITFV